MRAEAREELGVAAACLLATLGNDEHETDAEHARALAGAAMLIEAMNDLRLLRRMIQALTKA